MGRLASSGLTVLGEVKKTVNARKGWEEMDLRNKRDKNTARMEKERNTEVKDVVDKGEQKNKAERG